MLNDIFIIFTWWFLLFGLGIIFLPLTFFFFKNFLDQGYAFSKIIAILFISYVVWLLGSLKIVEFSIPGVWGIILFFAAINFLILKRSKNEIIPAIKQNINLIVFEEIVFFLALAAWSYVRGFQPDIEGLEKFMDFGFVNAILRSQTFPPLDMWLAGQTINYYYFGHLIAAVLTKISTLESAITYNLMIATIFAIALTGSFSILGNLIYFGFSKKMRVIFTGGIIGALLLTLGSNLHSLYWFITHNFSLAGYWYPDATRFIVEKFGALDNTIHEFPSYSFVVSDLHGHVSDIPFVLLILGLIISWINKVRTKSIDAIYLVIFGMILGVMFMTNAWDFPIYLLITGLTIFWLNFRDSNISLPMIKKTLVYSFSVLFVAVVTSLPFNLGFSQIAQGIAPVNAHSPFWQLLVLWGYPWFIGLTFIIFVLTALRKKSKIELTNNDIFILILLSVSTFLIVIPEFIYVKDIYIASYHRANTMFKLVYQSFMLYALSVGYIIPRLLTNIKKVYLRAPLLIIYVILISFPLYYPRLSVPNYYGNLKTYKGIWGLTFIKTTYPDNFAVIGWLNKNVTGQPTILEAVGDSYTEYNQISMATGLPTVEGWLVHEWLWRGSYDEPGKRAGEVQTIYETKDEKIALPLLKKYNVKYLIVGDLERKKYKVSEDKFIKLGKVIFESGNTRIYSLD